MPEKSKLSKAFKTLPRSFKGTSLKVISNHIDSLNSEVLSKVLMSGKASSDAGHLKALFLASAGIVVGD
jgi:hypothetical protein